MQFSNTGVALASVAAIATGLGASLATTRNRDPWTWDYSGPGSIEQIPSMLFPWCIPAIGAGVGAATLLQSGYAKSAAAMGMASLALGSFGITTWISGKMRNN